VAKKRLNVFSASFSVNIIAEIYTYTTFQDYLGITFFLWEMCYLAFLNHWGLQRSGLVFFFFLKTAAVQTTLCFTF